MSRQVRSYSRADIEMGVLLGRGKFGAVYRGMLHGRPVAIKIFDPTSSDQVVEDEKRTLSQCEHANIVKLIGFVREDSGQMIMEVLPYSLERKITELRWPSILRAIKGLASGLSYLHAKGFIFVDLKPANVMLDKNKNAKLCDLGSITTTRRLPISYDHEYGSLNIRKGGLATSRDDVFSFGLIVLQAVMREPLMTKTVRETCIEAASRNTDRHKRTIAGHASEKLPCPFDDAKAIVYLAVECVDGDPSRRPTMDNVVSRLAVINDPEPDALSSDEDEQ